jgi:hypothetical protein
VTGLPDHRHRRVEQQAKGGGLHSALGRLRRFAGLELQRRHAGLSGAASEGFFLSRVNAGPYDAPILN